MSKSLFALGAGVTLAIAALRMNLPEKSALPYYRLPDRTPEWLSTREANSSEFHHVSQFTLRDQHNDTVTERSLQSHVTVVHFFFTQCGGVCPTTVTNLSRLLAKVPDSRLQLLSHSVTPQRDSVPALIAYARRHDIGDRRWHLLTGQFAEIETLANRSYFVNLTDGKTYGVNNLAHTETLVLVDGRGRLRGMYTGTLPLDIDRLAEDIRILLAEQNGRS